MKTKLSAFFYFILVFAVSCNSAYTPVNVAITASIFRKGPTSCSMIPVIRIRLNILFMAKLPVTVHFLRITPTTPSG